MKKTMHIVAKSLLGLAMLAAGLSAWADSFPDKPIRVILPFPPGGTTDLVARIVSAKMKETLGQPLIVDNKAGAGTVIGSQWVAQSPADGYTVLWTATPLAINASLMDKLPYDTLNDLTMVGSVAAVPLVLVVPSSSPLQSVADLVKAAQAKAGSLSYGSSGVGGSAHLAAAMFFHEAGIELGHIPYKGSAPAIADLVGGHLDAVFDTLFLARPYVESGKARALAQTGLSRSPLMPDVPTLVESGYPNMVVDSWHIVAVPAATPKEVIQKLNMALVTALENEQVKAALVSQGLQLRGNTPEEANQYFRDEVARWGRAVEASGARAD